MYSVTLALVARAAEYRLDSFYIDKITSSCQIEQFQKIKMVITSDLIKC